MPLAPPNTTARMHEQRQPPPTWPLGTLEPPVGTYEVCTSEQEFRAGITPCTKIQCGNIIFWAEQLKLQQNGRILMLKVGERQI